MHGSFSLQSWAPLKLSTFSPHMAEYFYHILAARGSGEYALSLLLEPFAW